MDKHKNNILTTTIGVVVDTDDKAQLGRLRVYCPTIDDKNYVLDDLPWAFYSTPFGGTVKNIAAGPNNDVSFGPTSYGFWAVPKIGAQVIVFFINGDINYRVWAGCVFPLQGNRGLPAGRNFDNNGKAGPFTDSYEPLEPINRNLKQAGLDKGTHYLTRGSERQAAQAKTDKDGKEGYAQNTNRVGFLDPQTYSFTTPGHHVLTMCDAPEHCRVRLRTTSGNQVILDDTNERIYISTARGSSWIEMDQDGHIHFFGADSISFRTGGDFNVAADGFVNLEGKKGINIKTAATVNITGGADISLNAGGSVYNTAGADIHLGAGSCIIEKATAIHLNGPGTTAATIAIGPSVVPGHEPWTRPTGKTTRNKLWKA